MRAPGQERAGAQGATRPGSGAVGLARAAGGRG
jgi:hypothetical protein